MTSRRHEAGPARVRTFHAGLIVAAVLVAALWFRSTGVERALFRDWADDAFFYVIVADHIVEGLGSTSDGIGLTNGYHPLWMLVHVAIRWAFGDPLRPLAAVQFLLLAAALLLLYRYLSAYVGATAALLVALAGSFETTFDQVLGAGMETGLAFTALLALLLLLRGADLDTLTWRRRSALQAALAGVFFARLDGGLFWIALASVVLLGAPLRGPDVTRRARGLVRLFAPPAALAAAYLVYNARVFGTAMPISGRLKSVGWETVVAMGPVEYVGRAFDHLVVLYGLRTFPLPWGLSIYAPRRDPWHAGIWLGYLGLVALAVLLTVRHLERRGGLDLSLRTLLAGVALHSGYYALLQSDRYSLSWARGPELLLLSLAAVSLASRAVARPVLDRRLRRAAAAAAVAALIGLDGHVSRAKALHPGAIRDFDTSVAAFRQGVDYLRAHTGDDEIIASESIGFLGYYTKRRIVSLDGLLNSTDYYRRYLSTGRTAAYLREHGVRYIAEGLRKDVDPVAYMSGIIGVPPAQLAVEASFDGPASIPRRYVVLRLAAGDERK